MGATINNVGHGSQKRDEMNSLAVSYMGKPLHLLASVLWAMLSRLVSLFLRNKEVDRATFDKPAPPTPPQPLVRLKNLPQVSGCASLAAAGVESSSRGVPRVLPVQQRHVVVAEKTCRLIVRRQSSIIITRLCVLRSFWHDGHEAEGVCRWRCCGIKLEPT